MVNGLGYRAWVQVLGLCKVQFGVLGSGFRVADFIIGL